MTLRLRAQSLRWMRRGRRVLDIPELDLEGPGLVLLAGGTGSGKSSLLRALTGALGNQQGGHLSGRVDVDTGVPGRAPRIGYLPQDALDGFLSFDARSELELRLQASGWTRTDAVAEAERRIRRLGLEGRPGLPANRLSAGEAKRVALEASQAHAPDVLLLDEPLNHLDDRWRAALVEDLLAAAERSLVVVAGHEIEYWMALARDVVVLRHGSVAWKGAVPAFHEVRKGFPELRAPLASDPGPHPRVDGPAVVEAEGLEATRGRCLFRGLALRLPVGLHAVTGPNGDGKTTLLRMLAGLEAPDAGEVRIAGEAVRGLKLRERAEQMAVHFEAPHRLFFQSQARAELEFQPQNAGTGPVETAARVVHAADAFRIADRLSAHPASLSGGEQERLALACVEASGARVFLLDEPTQGLDADGWRDLLSFFERHRRAACIVVATHESELVRLCDSVHELRAGALRSVEMASPARLAEVVLRTPS